MSYAPANSFSSPASPIDSPKGDGVRGVITIAVIESADGVSAGDWGVLCPPSDPFLNRAFFSILERHGTAGPRWGWQARHLVARDAEGRVVGLLPTYLKHNGYGDFIGDWAWAGAWQHLGREYFPRLMSGLPHTPATGPRLLVDRAFSDAEARPVREALVAAAQELPRRWNLSSWHVAFPVPADREVLVPAGMLTSEDVQFHWRDAPGEGLGDFEGFLAGFSSARRKKVRAERRKVADSGLQIEVRHGHEVDPAEWPALHGLYATTFDKFDNHAVFTAKCFADLAAALGDRMVCFIARSGGDPVALSLCFRSDEALYGRYWGTRVEVDCLHFELCFYQGIAYCLREGLKRFEPGAGGEHKIARGFEPTTVRHAHWIADERMRGLIGRHLEAHKAAVEDYRRDASTHLPFKKAQ